MHKNSACSTTDADNKLSTSDNDANFSWRTSIVSEWRARRLIEERSVSPLFPLAMNPFGEEEIIAMTEVLLTGRLTLGKEVENAEKMFADMVGMPYAVMVNSGSSANLLAVSAVTNKLRTVHCDPGDHVLVPAVCWSTSLFPLIQNGLRPVFVDVDPQTFNVSLSELEKKLTNRVKAVMAVHVLGNSINMQNLLTFVKRHKLILIEDTCESLGSFCNTEQADEKKMLGTFGDFGTFSFYFSHHITSGEGGMIVCHTEDDYNLIRCLRAHGWTRHLTNREEVEGFYKDIDPRFLFVNMGYNVRPLEVQGAMLTVQLKKLKQFNACRRDNLSRIKETLLRDDKFSSLMSIMKASEGVDPAWFGLGILLHQPYAHQRQQFLKYLERNGIENRPIISGNFIRQPCISAFCEAEHPEEYPGAEVIHNRGLFIGIHQISLDQVLINKLINIIVSFPFSPHHIVLVTGSEGALGKTIQDVVSERPVKENPTTVPLRIQTQDTEWIFLTRTDGDLRNMDVVQNIFKRFQPTHIVHCATHSASPQEVSEKPVDFWLDNVSINNNILQAAFQFQTWNGPIKVVSVLSNIIFSTTASYPIDIPMLCGGSLSSLLDSYSCAKTSLVNLTQWYRQQYRCSFVTVLHTNFFGPYANFDSSTTPLVNAIIAKLDSQKNKNNFPFIKMMDTDETIEHVLFAPDLARIVIWALKNYDVNEPLQVAGEPVTIHRIAELVHEQLGFDEHCIFNLVATDDSVQNSRDMAQFQGLDLQFKMTSLSIAIKKTLGWYRKHKPESLQN